MGPAEAIMSVHSTDQLSTRDHPRESVAVCRNYFGSPLKKDLRLLIGPIVSRSNYLSNNQTNKTLGTFELWMALLGSFQAGQKQAIRCGERCLLQDHRSRPFI